MRTASTSAGAEGPERPTLIERIVGAIPLPYVAGAILLTLAISLSGLLAWYLETGSFQEALERVFGTVESLASWTVVVFLGIQVAIPLYAFLIVPYMRRKIVASTDALAPLVPGGAEAYRHTFAPVSRPLPPILLGGVIYLTLVLSSPLPPSPIFLIVLVPNLILFFAYGTAAWVYITAIDGLRLLGKKPLRLRRFYEDRWLGTRPLGSLSVSITVAFLLLLALLILQLPLSPTPLPPVLLSLNAVILAFPVALGALLFFFSLWNVHKQMILSKRREQEVLDQRLARALAAEGNPKPEGPSDLTEIRGLVLLEVADRRVASISAWPFDTGILGRFALAMVSLIAAVLARVILYVWRF